jgi:hypothetical protein
MHALLQSTGLLRVGSEPPASLAVDGVTFSRTPLAVRRANGRHLIELSRPGFATIRRWITVGPETEELRLALLSQAAPEPPAEPAPDAMQAVMRARRRQISACYEHALKRDPGLAGTITLALRLGPAGQVLGTTVESDTLADPAVTECLRREAAGWAFAGAHDATVVYPFVFRTP